MTIERESYLSMDRRRITGDHDLLIRMDTNMENLTRKVEQHITEVKQQFADQNIRIALLERGYWIGIGILTVVNLVFIIIAKMVVK